MAKKKSVNQWAGTGWHVRILQILTAVLGCCALLGPQGYPQGRAVYLGEPHTQHLYPREWGWVHEWYSRTAVVVTCALAYLAGLVRLGEGRWPRRARAVVALLCPFLVIYGEQVTRLAEMGERSSTGWGLWCIVPFVYAAIADR